MSDELVENQDVAPSGFERAKERSDPWGVYYPSNEVDILTFSHGIAAIVVHGDPVPRSLWLGARLLWWRRGDTFFLGFKRYDGEYGSARFIMLAEVSKSVHRSMMALHAHQVIDVLVIDKNAESDTGSHEDIVLFGAVHA